MELVTGRTVQVGVLAYVLGGGFALMKSIDDYVFIRRHPNEQYENLELINEKSTKKLVRPTNVTMAALNYSGHEAWRSAKIAMAGMFIAQSVAFARHGRYDRRTQNILDVPLALAAGVASSSLIYLGHVPWRQRLQKSLTYGLAAGCLDAARLLYIAQSSGARDSFGD